MKTFNDRIVEMYHAYICLQKHSAKEKEPRVWDFDECNPNAK